MKTYFVSSVFAMVAMAFPMNSLCFDLKGLFGGGASSGSDGDVLGQIGSAITSLTATKDISLDDLNGVWVYSAPAVTFESDNALQKIGGVAASTAIEDKLQPYYQKFGVTNLVVTISEDHTFVMKMRIATLKGNVTQEEEGRLTFNFNAFGKISLGKISANASKSGNTLILTFDAKRLVSIVEKVSAIAGSTTLSTLSKLLSSYDGLYCGCRLALDGDAPSTSGNSSESSKGDGLKGLFDALSGRK